MKKGGKHAVIDFVYNKSFYYHIRIAIVYLLTSRVASPFYRKINRKINAPARFITLIFVISSVIGPIWKIRGVNGIFALCKLFRTDSKQKMIKRLT